MRYCVVLLKLSLGKFVWHSGWNGEGIRLAAVHILVTTICARARITYITVTEPFLDVIATDVFENVIFHPYLLQ